MAEQEKREREQQNLIKKAKPTPDKIDPYATAPPQSPPRPKGGSATIGFSAAAKRKRILRRSLILRLGNSKSEPEIELSKPRDFQHVSHLEGESVNNSIFSVLELLCNPANDANSSPNNSNTNLSPTSTPFLSASTSNVRFGSLSSLPPPPDPPTSPPASSRKSPKGKTSSTRTKRQKRPKRKKAVTQGARELPPLDLYQTANGKNDPKKEDQKEATQAASTTSSEVVKVNEVEDSNPQQGQLPSATGEEVESTKKEDEVNSADTTSTTTALADSEVTPKKEERPQLGRIASLRSFWEQIPQSPEKPPEPKLDGSGGAAKVEEVAVVPPMVKDAISKIEEKEKLRVPTPRGTSRSPSAARMLTPRSMSCYTPAPPVNKMADFCDRLGLPELISIFEAEDVSYADLFLLTEEDFTDLGIKMGPRKRILNAVREIKTSAIL